METTLFSDIRSPDIGDFAVTDSFNGNVVLEANEWDSRLATHHVVTLYLQPDCARALAEQLLRCAAESDLHREQVL